MSKTYNLQYIGAIRSLVANGSEVAFVTEHAEAKATALYVIDAESNKLETTELPCGGLAVCKQSGSYWIGGSDGLLYSTSAKDKAAKALKTSLPNPATKIVAIGEHEIGCLTGDSISIVDSKGNLIQSLEINSIEIEPNDAESVETEASDDSQNGNSGARTFDSATSLAASAEGDWLAIGTKSGRVFVFERENKKEFELSESADLHKGEVTSLLFDPDELRFWSAGTDQKLLLTHARGSLEPEDRGRANNHDKRVTAMVLAGEDRFITGSTDKTCKTWTRNSATKPATLSESIIAVNDLAIAIVHKRAMLVASQSDNSIRMYLVSDDGRFGQFAVRFNDGYRRATELFKSKSPGDRGAGLHELAIYDDLESLELISNQVVADKDSKLRVTAVELLTKSNHEKHVDFLEPLLVHDDQPVRQSAFDYLSSSTESNQDLLELCRKAIGKGFADIGCKSLTILKTLATDKSESDAFRNRARDLMVQSIDSDTIEIRRTAILTLESVFEKNSPRPDLIALQSKQKDSRRIALLRLMQRELLSEQQAAAGIRQMIEDSDPDVRQTAVLLLILSQKQLANAVRELDSDIDRQLFDLENFTIEVGESKPANKPAKASANRKASAGKKSAKLTAKSKADFRLKDQELQPLLVAVSARAMDTCLIGARCLAFLGDQRAFGILMQLSREEDVEARVRVCQSLASLGDPRANDRLGTLLTDEAIEVRDAAYSALERVKADDPLSVAEDGLAADAEDVRRRGLDTLVKQIRKTKSKESDSSAGMLLKRALNDGALSVRFEAFKVALNLKINGGNEKTLRFILTSIHEDIRREVLTELMANKDAKWSEPLCLDLLDDAAEQIRVDAFNHLEKFKKETEVTWLGDAIVRKYSDIREQVVRKLIANRTVESRKLLASAINDSETNIRLLVLESLVDSDSVEQLRECLGSEHDDVQLGAAYALATRGDVSAREVLVSFAKSAMPGEEAFQPQWKDHLIRALSGLSELGDPSTLDVVLAHLQNDDEAIRFAAAKAIPWVASENTLPKVKLLMQHDQASVATQVGFALALAGDVDGIPLVFSKESNDLDGESRLMAAVALGDSTESRLMGFIDFAGATNRNVAMLILLCRDWLNHDGSAKRLIGCLASRAPRARLLAAKCLELFTDEKAYAQAISTIVNDRGPERAWKVSNKTIRQIASTIVFAPKQVVARLIPVLRELDSDKQNKFDDRWELFFNRYQDAVNSAVETADKTKLPQLETDQDGLNQLAFGTYVGLAREQGSYHQRGQKPGFGATIVSIRSTALRRLIEMCQDNKSLVGSAVSVLTQTAGDPNQEVRQLAFEQLATLDVSVDRRASIAIETGHRDLAVAGLTLLTKSGSKKDQKLLLQNVVLTRNDEIAFEAAKLLKTMMDIVKVSELCFDSPYMQLPMIATSWLGEIYDDNEPARKMLRALAMDSEFENVRQKAIAILVAKKDERAFESLVKVMDTSDQKVHAKFLPLFSQLRDSRGPAYLVEQIAKNQFIDAKQFLVQIGNARDPSVNDQLFELVETAAGWRSEVFLVLQKISGYDQPIEDPNELQAEQPHLESQFPRFDEVLARLLETVHRFGNAKQLIQLIPSARWAKSSVVDSALATIASHPDEVIRRSAIEAIGFRAEKRDGGIGPLKDAIDHRDPVTQFLGAEGLAKANDSSGIQILMTAVELMDDLKIRRRAVSALGYLGDERAFEILMRLVCENGHALQDRAAEAIGHLSKSDCREQIVKTLTRLVGEGGSAGTHALIGLRFLNVPEGWDLIREQTLNSTLGLTAIEQLGYNEDEATRDLLLELLENNYSDPTTVLDAARRSFGDQSIEPELAWIRGAKDGGLHDAHLHTILSRVFEGASPDQVLEAIGTCPRSFRVQLNRHLLKLVPLPIESAIKFLESANPVIVESAAWLLGRSGNKKHSSNVDSTLKTWRTNVVELEQQMISNNEYSNRKFREIRNCVLRLIWATGAMGGGEETLAEIVSGSVGSELLQGTREAAARLLTQQETISAAVAKRIRPLLDDHNATIRSCISAALALDSKSKLDEVAEQLLPDRVAFTRLADQKADEIRTTLRKAAAEPHYQNRAMPYLIAAKDVETLADVAQDRKQNLITRKGAVEGLASMAIEESEQVLVLIGNDEQNEEELRKLAWRGLRRSKRRRQKELVK